MDLKDLYQEIILDHGKNPRNLKSINNYNIIPLNCNNNY